MNEIKEFILSKNKPISSCKDLYKHFIGRHKVIPVYLTPKFEMELECIMNKLEDLENEKQKLKDKIKQAIIYIKNIDENDFINTEHYTELLNILEKRKNNE